MQLQLRNISKSFYGTKALSDVSLTVNAGKVNCLVGENGAGKSTLIKIIAGFYEKDNGDIIINDKNVDFKYPKDSQDYGISVIHQELMLIPELTVSENIFLGYWPLKKFKLVNKKIMDSKAKAILKQLGSDISPLSLISSLSTGEQQIIEIAKALSRDVKLLVLDEPTASLSNYDAEILLDIVKRLKKQGIGILYISHRLEEVFSISDSITVLKDGKFVACKKRSETSKDEIVKLMVGHSMAIVKNDRNHKNIGKKVLEIKNLNSENKFRNISFKLYEGEILGIAGLVGAGRSEILRAIYGEDSFDYGEILLYDELFKVSHPSESILAGISMVPEDRKIQGLIMGQSIKNNITIGILNNISKFGFLNNSKERYISQKFKEMLNIKAKSISDNVETLSGGNQQKVVLSKSFAINPKILLLDEPTRGVDVGARREIHKLIKEATEQKIAFLVVSSEIEELLEISDRILILRDGKIIKECNSSTISKEEVISLATK